MNRLWQQLAIATNWPILVSVAVLSSLGTISIWADDPKTGSKQLIFLGVSAACMVLVQAVNYQKIGRFAWGFYFVGLMMILYTLLPGVPRSGPGSVPEIKGVHKWIEFHYFNIEPAEVTKVAFVLVLARYLRFRSNYRNVLGLLPPFMLAFFPVIMIMKQPDLGTAMTFVPALFAMLFVAGAKIRHLMAVVALAIVSVPLLWMCGPAADGAPGLPVLKHLPSFVRQYQRVRVKGMFSHDPAVVQSTGFQQEHALTAFGSGGMSGKGALHIPVGQRVPEGHNDMIFALIGEQFGFFGAAVVLFSYIVLFAAGVEISAATREPFGKLVALGLVSIFAGQTFFNLTVCLRLMPVTGVTLPFVSYGGSSLLASFVAVGLLLNIGQNRPLVMARDSFEFE